MLCWGNQIRDFHAILLILPKKVSDLVQSNELMQTYLLRKDICGQKSNVTINTELSTFCHDEKFRFPRSRSSSWRFRACRTSAVPFSVLLVDSLIGLKVQAGLQPCVG